MNSSHAPIEKCTQILSLHNQEKSKKQESDSKGTKETAWLFASQYQFHRKLLDKLRVGNYKNQYRYYPYRVPRDKIYQNRANRNKMKELRIEMVGAALGRPSKESKTPQYKKELKKAPGERNEVEGYFGTAKRRYDMNNIRARLSYTAESWIAAGFFVLNLQRFLKGLFFALKLALIYGPFKLNDTVLIPIRNYINRISQQREFVNFSVY